ncbi:Hypothetical protein NTJ_10751 [Nesidiocoris tenuis]|uniref:Uncharacterized protein n=1 Tax=Nesidiocoris tenuis TaxID=355587 RepID=A0ABN7B447_9HEMI|nr:Hypothetical protein NTJ_10751 [Nesidiocoris tenuis]
MSNFKLWLIAQQKSSRCAMLSSRKSPSGSRLTTFLRVPPDHSIIITVSKISRRDGRKNVQETELITRVNTDGGLAVSTSRIFCSRIAVVQT